LGIYIPANKLQTVIPNRGMISHHSTAHLSGVKAWIKNTNSQGSFGSESVSAAQV